MTVPTALNLRHTEAECFSPQEAREALAAWLLSDAVQIPKGSERGGIVGWLDEQGRADFVYPEITGYYLQWLAWHVEQHGISDEAMRRAGAAQDWLDAWLARTGPPLTRTYLRSAPDDWRNHALFCFDLAMALRGLGAAARMHLLQPKASTVARLCALLSRLVEPDGTFQACLPHEPSALLPIRWSTLRGSFLAKAAAGIIAASAYLPDVPRALRQAAEETYSAALDRMLDHPHEETHALVYAMEGVLVLPRHRRFADMLVPIAQQLEHLMSLTHAWGRVPETRGDLGAHRLDIVAQALRAGVLLRTHAPHLAPPPQALEKLRQHLARHVVTGRGLPFDPHAARPQYNLWASMFAEQALWLARERDTRHTIADSEPLLV